MVYLEEIQDHENFLLTLENENDLLWATYLAGWYTWQREFGMEVWEKGSPLQLTVDQFTYLVFFLLF